MDYALEALHQGRSPTRQEGVSHRHTA